MKQNFKRVLSLIAISAVFLTLVACSTGTSPSQQEAKPSAVTNLKGIPGDTKASVRWTNPEASSFSGVEIFFGESEDSLESIEKITNTNTNRYVKSDLTNDKTYYFRVDAYFGTEEAYKSNVISVIPSETAALNISSVDFAKELVIGWNLGNAFDASSCDDWAYSAGLSLEYNWLPHKQATSRNLIKAVKAAGFNTIRIPVSWHNHMSKNDSNYTIDSAWMKRVKEVVDWAIAEDMYVILNIHHDNINETEIKTNPGFCITTNAAAQKKSKEFIQRVWEQICDNFNEEYNEKLIFEVLNEPRSTGTDWEWGFWGSNAGKAKTYCDVITSYEQVALDTIRASCGMNAVRFVMTPSYAASPDWLGTYTLPEDSVDDKLLLSTHAYTPGDFALDGNKDDYDKNKSYIEGAIDGVFNKLSTNYIKKGIGIVMGEASASDKKNLSSREKWVEYYFTKANAVGIPVVLWDNEQTATKNGAGGENHGYFDRSTCKQYYPTLIEAMMKAVGSSSGGDNQGTKPEQKPSDDNGNTETGSTDSKNGTELLSAPLVLSDDKWGINTTISAANFSSATDSSKLIFTYEKISGCDYINIKLQDGSWNDVFSAGELTNATLNKDVFSPSENSDTIIYKPTASEWSTIKSKGLVVYGYGAKISSLKLE